MRLDRPVTAARSVPWRLVGKTDAGAAGEVELATGALVFPAGRESAPLPLPALGAGGDGFAFLALVLGAGDDVEVTGHATATWFDAAFPEPPAPPAATVLFARSTAGWSYLAQGSAPPAGWTEPGFDAAGWTGATAPFHTAESSVGGTAVPGNASNGNLPHNTVYFRRAFTVADPADFATLTVHCMRDDGVIVRINGQEVKRDNMPAGAATHNTAASSTINGSAESVWHAWTGLSAAPLVAGTNVLSVEVHQASISGSPPLTDSSDMRLNLELLGQPAGPPAPVNWAVTPLDGGLHVLWDDAAAVLEMSADLEGSWQPVPGAASPVVLRPEAERMFFRLRR